MVDIHHTVNIDVPVDQVYQAVTEEEGLRGWWTRKAIAAPEIGHKNEFPFPSGDYNAMRIVDLEPDARVEWICIEGAVEWVGTRIVFAIGDRDGATTLLFTHADWQEDTPFFRMCRKAWEWYLASLKQYCEKGMGTPS